MILSKIYPLGMDDLNGVIMRNILLLQIIIFIAFSCFAWSEDTYDVLKFSDKSKLEGKIMSVDKEKITFKLKGTEYVINIKWSSLPKKDVDNLGKVLGEIKEHQITFPPFMVDKLVMKNDTEYIGFINKEKSSADYVNIKLLSGETKILVTTQIEKTEEVGINRLKMQSPEEIMKYMDDNAKLESARDYFHHGRTASLLGMWDKAIENYNKCSEMDSRLKKKTDEKIKGIPALKEKFQKAFALKTSAEDLEKQEKKEDAVKIYQKVVDEYPDFLYSDMIVKKIKELTGQE